MSGLVSGITKVFSPVIEGIGRIGSAIKGVGASVFTTGAATGSSLSSLAGGVGGGGVLSSMLRGAAKLASFGPAGLVGGLAAAGPIAAASALPGLAGGFSSLAPAAADVTASIGTTAAAAAPSFLDRAGSFLGSETGMGAIAGLGKGLMAYEEQKSQEEDRQKDRDYLLGKEQRLRDSYSVPSDVLADGASTGVVKDKTKRPTPADAYARSRYEYNSQTHRLEKVYT